MNGLLLIDKPKDFTSQDVVSKVKKILNVKKAGHIGTLDPMATGLLPILIGDYTKISKYLIEHDKTYIAKLKLGIKTDTGDITGNILEKQEISQISNIEETINSFKGVQKQTPPMYSAIKIDGKKLYEYAREGKEVEVPERKIEIYDIRLLNVDDGEIEFMVSCSKGTYIRVLCEDIARALGTIGTMSSLRRTIVDKFSIDDAYTFEELENSKDDESILIKMEDIFNDIDEINLNTKKLELFLNGVKLSVELEDGQYNIYSDNKYIGLGIVKNKLLKRDVVIGE
jgi:tRNA pseudouridine55 synthase